MRVTVSNPSVGSVTTLLPSFANPLWLLKYYYKLKGYPTKEAERRSIALGLKIARPILMTQGVMLPVSDDALLALSDVELKNLVPELKKLAGNPQFIAGVTSIVGAKAGGDPKMAAAMMALQGGMGGQVPTQMPMQMPQMPQQMPMQIPMGPSTTSTVPIGINPRKRRKKMMSNPHNCSKCGGRLAYITMKHEGKTGMYLRCQSCGAKFKRRAQPRLKSNPVGAVVVPKNSPTPEPAKIEEAKEQFKEFNNDQPKAEVKRAKIALPDSEAPIIEIPGGPVAVEYRSGKETKDPNQKYRHEFEASPPGVNMGFVKGKEGEGDTILIYGKGVKVDDWIRG